ncbi:MAG: replicative DNA helicase [Candidatus Coatesbacteria bacterium 4484_99]|uniref:Replicative DNA helicase n=1 Tax=Candidatus Coatesbacteria bacterium 4484_99 TaxID=1970774 RepID=A0A1W9S293_9BACT|nr:MAG: replicative DNA helicase [Candidatus Coatesbacteria bacterium 4484_99]RLC40682.1 MAG: replicative DNA helicase [Candidatus Coatesbacteria bacterium]RLC41240.1 MAG: replicative DNA helicase [Candidatus Coatesbacteria bacterium]RLC42665.1 MAG: replicative DNA helicase [Candidatus Coatesbacteria bacterium]
MDDTILCNLEAEKAIIGSLLLETSAIEEAYQRLQENSFYYGKHRLIFKAIMEIYSQGKTPDAITVIEELKRNGRLEDAGGLEYIKEIISDVATTAHLNHYIEIVEDIATKRRIIEAAKKILDIAESELKETDDIINFAEETIYDISKQRIQSFFFPIRDLVTDTVDHIEEVATRKGITIGLSTGFSDFDDMTAGLQKQDLIIIAGRPTCGKTSFALDIARHVALVEEKPVAIFSIEMSKEQLALRMLCAEAKVNAHRVRKGHVADADWTPILNAAGRLKKASIYIDDTPALSVFDMRAKARRLASQENIALIIVDYLQLMRGRSTRPESRQAEVAEISRFLKSLAKELDVPVVAVSQLSRDIEKHGNRRPQLSDLRESGAIEQDADIVAFLWRYRRSSEQNSINDYDFSNCVELIIGKQRNGPTGTVLLVFREDYMSFGEMTIEDKTEYWQRIKT